LPLLCTSRHRDINQKASSKLIPGVARLVAHDTVAINRIKNDT
jgi:hypothetical protein